MAGGRGEDGEGGAGGGREEDDEMRKETDVWAHNEDCIAMCATIAAMRLRLHAWLRDVGSDRVVC